MSIEGEINLSIGPGVAGHAGSRGIEISSSRKTNVADFLKGKPRSQAVEILPLLFNVCGQAHALASSSACAREPLTSEAVTAGDLVVLCENAREHLLRIFTGWGQGIESDLSAVPFQDIIGFVAKMKLAVSDETGAPQISHPDRLAAVTQIADQLDAILEQHIFHCPAKEWLSLLVDEQLARWAARVSSVPANYINRLYENNWQAVGCIKPNFLPALCPDELVQHMHGDQSDKFICEPDWNGACYETGCLARNYYHPLMSAVIQKYGAGLLARQVARLVELATLSEQMRALVLSKRETSACDERLGFGQVETARGQLTHSVLFRDDEISDYKILAPTEWNFHPHGVVCDSLKSLMNSDCSDHEILIPMIVEAIDPCVPYHVRMN